MQLGGAVHNATQHDVKMVGRQNREKTKLSPLEVGADRHLGSRTHAIALQTHSRHRAPDCPQQQRRAAPAAWPPRGSAAAAVAARVAARAVVVVVVVVVVVAVVVAGVVVRARRGRGEKLSPRRGGA